MENQIKWGREGKYIKCQRNAPNGGACLGIVSNVDGGQNENKLEWKKNVTKINNCHQIKMHWTHFFCNPLSPIDITPL